MFSRVIGIDLGTTYSCVGVWLEEEQRVKIIENDQGKRTTPSAVAFTDSSFLTGEPAQNQAYRNMQNTIVQIKRLMGRNYSDDVVQELLQHWQFEVVKSPDSKAKAMVSVSQRGAKKQFYPEEISGFILRYMKHIAEVQLGGMVDQAVITVPAYFNDTQRQATLAAGKLAGLNVLRIINEPTAAAIAYGLGHTKDKMGQQRVLVFDLGGGTFDVSILTIEDGIYEVLATNGDTNLGGEDFNQRMVLHFIKEFDRKYKKSMASNSRAKQRLLSACERAKVMLSSSQSAPLEIDELHEGQDYHVTLSRAKFEELCLDLFQKCIDLVDEAIKDAKLNKDDIDDIVLVGGSSRIPKIQQMLLKYLGGNKVLSKSINPDEAVAYGAAFQGASLVGQGSQQVKDLVLVDVTPLSLGVDVHGGKMCVVVPKNTSIPCKKVKSYTTIEDNQTKIRFKVYQGERSMSQDNHLLGSFLISGLQQGLRGTPSVEVTFDINADGVIRVSAEDQHTKTKGNITITGDQSKLSDEEIRAMLREAEKYILQDQQEKRRVESKIKLGDLIYSKRRTLAQRSMSRYKEERLRAILEDFEEWLKENEDSKQEAFDKQVQQLKQKCALQGV